MTKLNAILFWYLIYQYKNNKNRLQEHCQTSLRQNYNIICVKFPRYNQNHTLIDVSFLTS